MGKLIRAELYGILHGKLIWFLAAGALVSGFLVPSIYYLMFRFFDLLTEATEGIMVSEDIAALTNAVSGLKEMMNADAVFLTCIPFTNGYGLFIVGAVSFFSARQFSNGIIRNKIIAGHSRSGVLAAMCLSSLFISLPSALVYTLCSALCSRLIYGEFKSIDGADLLRMTVLVMFIYLFYSVIPVTVSFTVKSVPKSMIISLALPVAVGAILSLIATAAGSFPDVVTYFLCALPSFQLSALTVTAGSDAFLAIAVAADAVLAAATAAGVGLYFRKSDLK